MGLAGVDGCRGGWVAVIEGGDGRLRADAFEGFAELAAAASEGATVAVDMPIGLPEQGGRECEAMLRAVLGARRSSVFPIPSRAAVYAVTERLEGIAAIGEGHRRALAVARRTSRPPAGFSRQAFMIFPRIREIDRLLAADPDLRARVFESHPEGAFHRMNGNRGLHHPKKRGGRVWEPGMAERRDLLAGQGLDADWMAGEAASLRRRVRGLTVEADDFLDACAMLVVARRIRAGTAESFPPHPPDDATGLPVAIWV